ncbi:MAG TPA: hypothetical protein VFA04_26015 [Bryobacteraceae bacterium]|nr:hypothetical protein [Bryobacteraceae bacterium]
MLTAQNVSFHEAGIKEARLTENRTIVLALEGVHTDDVRRDAEVRIGGVRVILRDSCLIDDFAMESPDGEILSLENRDGVVSLIIEWNDFDRKEHFTRAYQITCDSIAVDIFDAR